MAKNNIGGMRELKAYLREELNRIARGANGMVAEVIDEAIQRLRAESDGILAEVYIDTNENG